MPDLEAKIRALRAVQPQMRSVIVEKYIRAYHGETVVVKYGGGAMTKPALKDALARDLALMKHVGIKPVLVHGGGPEITEMMERLKMPVEFVGGYRRTGSEAMEIVKLVLVGKINKELVGLINSHGAQGVGLSGDDAQLILAKKKTVPTDLGFVGDVININTALINSLLDLSYIPVIASVGVGKHGESYNINADSVAAEVAVALKAHHIIFLTNVDGLYREFGDHASLISEITYSHVAKLVEQRQISGGMLPKTEACLRALDGGVGWVHILNGTKPHTMLQEIFTRKGAGTMIINDQI